MKKLLKFLGSYNFLFMVWIVFLLSPSLSLMRFEIINRKILGNLHINGLTTILYYFQLIISLVALGILGLHFRDFISGKIIQNKERKSIVLLTILTFLFLLLAVWLLNLENINYPNFVYGRYGITVAQLKLMSFICSLEVLGFITAYIYLIRIRGSNWKTDTGSLAEKASFYIAVIGLLSMAILSSSTFFEWKNLLSDARSNYVGRVGNDYRYLKLVSSETPHNATIILPPQGDLWPAIGNQPVARYFLFPRLLVSGSLMTDQVFAESLNETYFPKVPSTTDRPEWPRVNLKDKSIIFNFDKMVSIKYKTIAIEDFQNDIIYKVKF